MSNHLPTLDLTLPSPAENLALDEALLLDAEAGQGPEVLRFWMSPTPFVVVGLGGKVREEVQEAACEARHIPVLRRCSGGGTVVQGRGCLNYALILQVVPNGPLSTIQGANRFIMERNAAALSGLLNRPLTTQGHTDLTLDGLKISGNAQRRLRHYILFHGTFLLNFDLSLIRELLPTPALQPTYRKNRSHEDFLANLGVTDEEVKRALRAAWEVSTLPETSLGTRNCGVAQAFPPPGSGDFPLASPKSGGCTGLGSPLKPQTEISALQPPGSCEAGDKAPQVPFQRVRELVEQRYSRQDWNHRR